MSQRTGPERATPEQNVTARTRYVPRGVRWTFTINNYMEHEWQAMEQIASGNYPRIDLIRYLVAEQEVGNQNNTPHIQGYFEISERMRCNELLHTFPFLTRAHLEIAKGTRLQNKAYCTKEQPANAVEYKAPHEKEPKSGQQSYQLLAESIKEGHNIIDIFEENPRLALLHRNAIIAMTTDYRQTTLKTGPYHLVLKKKNLWIWGEPGTGKSYFAESRQMTTYIKNSNKWWDGYHGQQLVIIEDLDPDSCKHMAKFLKNWADDYPILCEIKGSAQLWPPTFCLIVTSNYHPRDCFPNEQDLQAILRRFSVIKFSLLRGERMAEVEGIEQINPVENLNDLPKIEFRE